MGIFGRELYKILSKKTPELGSRDDPVWHPLRRIGILPAIIQRLQRAAAQVEERASLQPRDFENLIDNLPCTEEEEKRLKVALIAQGVENFLMGRMIRHSSAIADAVQIAQLVNDRLQQTYEGLYNRARGDSQSVVDKNRLELIFVLADRAGEMMQEMIIAQEEKDQISSRFWKSITIVAYQEIVKLFQGVDHELHDTFLQILRDLKAHD